MPAVAKKTGKVGRLQTVNRSELAGNPRGDVKLEIPVDRLLPASSYTLAPVRCVVEETLY